MKTSKASLVRILFGIVLMSSIIANAILIVSNDSLYKEKNIELLKSDSILSTKLLLDKEIDDLTKKINSLNKENNEFKNISAQYLNEIEMQKNKISNLIAENNSVTSLKNKLNELKEINKDLDIRINSLLSEKDTYSGKFNMLNKEYEFLSENYKKNIEFNKQLKVDNIYVEKFKSRKNKRLISTTKAKFVNKITVNFDFFENSFASIGEKTAHLVLADPKGNIVGSNDAFFTVNNKTTKYSSMQTIKFENSNKPYSIHLDLSEKLNKGMYKVSLFVDGIYSGRTQFVLN